MLLSDPRSSVEAVAAITSWVRSCACDLDLCATSRTLVANAIRSRHAFNTGISLMGELRGVMTPDGSNVGEDLFAEIAEPELYPSAANITGDMNPLRRTRETHFSETRLLETHPRRAVPDVRLSMVETAPHPLP